MPPCLHVRMGMQRAIKWNSDRNQHIDFCLCIGDDTSDELMFTTLKEQDQVRASPL